MCVSGNSSTTSGWRSSQEMIIHVMLTATRDVALDGQRVFEEDRNAVPTHSAGRPNTVTSLGMSRVHACVDSALIARSACGRPCDPLAIRTGGGPQRIASLTPPPSLGAAPDVRHDREELCVIICRTSRCLAREEKEEHAGVSLSAQRETSAQCRRAALRGARRRRDAGSPAAKGPSSSIVMCSNNEQWRPFLGAGSPFPPG